MNIDKILNITVKILLLAWLIGVIFDFVSFELLVKSGLFLILAKLYIIKK